METATVFLWVFIGWGSLYWLILHVGQFRDFVLRRFPHLNPTWAREHRLETEDEQRDADPDDPDLDLANEVGSMGRDYTGPSRSFSQQLSAANRQRQWNLNYQEAAIYLQEGQNNDKFNTHPHSHEALPAYQLAHNPWFYCLDLFAAIMVISLAALERPAVKALEMPVGIHGSIEMLCLLILSIELGIRLKWLGWREFFKHKRTMLKCFVLLLMLLESIVVIVRQTNHFRVTRALRPIFLIHTHYCKGVRRIVRQIVQSMPPILDMMLLLLFFMMIFSILAFYIFSGIEGDENFSSFRNSFISLFVLLTTANYPDVMMTAYAKNRLYSVFFIVYLSIELYFLMNLLLAVVYDKFSTLEKNKVQALYIHKREGCIRAFRLLVTQNNNNYLTVKHFIGMMEFFVPSKTRREYYLMFKSLNTSESGMLSLEEFFEVYNAAKLQWKLKNDASLWSSHFVSPLNKMFKGLHWFATCKVFDYTILLYAVPKLGTLLYVGVDTLHHGPATKLALTFCNLCFPLEVEHSNYLIIAGNFLWIVIETIRISADPALNVANYDFTASWVSVVFVCIYSIEAVIKVLGRGPMDYFTKGWDLFDFLVTVISVVGVFGEIFDASFYYVMVLRPFRLLRLFKIKKRYRDVLGTLFVLFSKLISMAICIVIVYYFYAIIAMEVFLNVDLKNCCKNTSVAFYYAYNKTSTGFYYLNNFENLFASGVTLFELTVVNNWFIIMEGYAHGVSQWTRLYFMSFYLVMMVVMNIVVAFVLESFMFRILYRRKMQLNDIEDHNTYKEEKSLSKDEMGMVSILSHTLTGRFIPLSRNPENSFVYIGERPQSREDFSLRMYSDEIPKWIVEFEGKRQTIESMEKLRNRRRPNSQIEGFSIEHQSESEGSFSMA